MPHNHGIAHVHMGPGSTGSWLPGALVFGLFLALAGCGDSSPPPPPPPPPPPVGGRHSGPTPAAGGESTRPEVKLPPVAWVDLTRPPEFDPPPFTPADLTDHHLIAVAVPVAAFPTVTQGDRQYRQALFQDWSLVPWTAAVDDISAHAGEAVACRAAVAGLQGQFSVASQKDPTTQKIYLRAAMVSGNADAIHLVFLVPNGAEPFTVQYQKKEVFLCAPQADAALINRLFLPKRPPSRWQDARIDLQEQPLIVKDFGSCVEIRRETYLTRKNDQGAMETVKPAAGKVFFSLHFAAQNNAFDFHTADWRLTMADSSSVLPLGISANGGQTYLLQIQDVGGFSGGNSTTPTVLFEAPANGTPLKLQFRTQVISLPQ